MVNCNWTRLERGLNEVLVNATGLSVFEALEHQ